MVLVSFLGGGFHHYLAERRHQRIQHTAHWDHCVQQDWKSENQINFDWIVGLSSLCHSDFGMKGRGKGIRLSAMSFVFVCWHRRKWQHRSPLYAIVRRKKKLKNCSRRKIFLADKCSAGRQHWKSLQFEHFYSLLARQKRPGTLEGWCHKKE